ncbi:MAG: hypothetical protein QOI21_4152 [Actinomycetota bacterium]|jgi:hypothetical protein|nr:hypothetical protein [Actinomycetota bacterium]
MTSTKTLRRGAVSGYAAALVLLAACQSPGPGGDEPPAVSPTGDQQILGIGRDYSQCVRDHGISDFPDMVVAGGTLSLPDNAAGDAADQALRADTATRDACRPVLDRLPAAGQKNAALSQQDRENLLKYAQCVRDNGIPDWPDPQADGSFAVAGTPLENEGKSARMQTASQACKKYWDKGISVK